MIHKTGTKALSWLLTLALMLGLLPGLGGTALAANSGTCGNNLSWTLEDSTLTISGSGAMADYENPSDEPWYNDRYGINAVVIGNGVTSIGNGAFDSCTNLASVTIPDSVTSIGEGAFRSCSQQLTSVTIPNNVTSIGEGAFNGCTNLASVNIPAGVTIINNYTFGSTKLIGVTIPTGVTSIGNNAFQGCHDLASVTIPNTVTSIGSYAFSGCSKLASVEIPNSVTSIGGSAFADCGNLTSIEIPNGVTNIGDYTFQYCYKLSSVTIPDSVTSIGKQAFQQCASLSSVTIPGTVTSIGQKAFDYCTYLSTVTFTCATANQTLTVGTDAFKDVTATAAYSASTTALYDGDTAIGAGASLTSLAGKTLTWKALPAHTHDEITFTAWSSADGLPTEAGSYYLTSDVTLSGTWTVPSGNTNLCLNGKTVAGIFSDGSEAVIKVGNSSTLNLYDDGEGKIISKDYEQGSNPISVAVVDCSGTFIMNGGTLSSIEEEELTQGVTLAGGGSFTMNGGTIESVFRGVSVWNSTDQFTMNSGTIRNCKVYGVSNDGSFTMTGGTITGNYNGVCVDEDGVVYLSGAPEISKNGSNEKNVNLMIYSGAVQVAGALTNTTPIGVGIEKPVSMLETVYTGVFTTGSTNTLKASDYADRFTSDNTAYSVVVDGNELKLAQAPVASVTPSGGSATEYPSLSDALAAWTEDSSTLKLLADVETSDTISVSGTKTLDLNGYGVMYTGSNNASVITVDVGAALTLKDSNATTTHYITLTDGRGTAVSDTASDGAIEVTGGYITGGLGSEAYSGGPIQGAGVFVSGSFTMEGGSIVGNTAKGGGEYATGEGGGVYVVNNSAFTMNGGTITANTAKGGENGNGYGGGVYVGNDSMFTMTGGAITANTAKGGGEYATGEGGGVYVVTGGAFTMNDGTISGNTASTDGGGVYVTNDCTFTMNDGAVSGNTANNEGGGVYVSNSSTFSMNDGTVTGNTASTNGGGVYVHGGDSYHYNPQYARNPAQFEVSGGVTIKDNMDTAATPAASNVYLGIDKDSNHNPDYDAKITVTGALTNTAPIGVTMQTPGVFTSGGIAKNYAARFTSDDSTYSVAVEGNELKLAMPPVAYMAWDEASKTVKAVEGGCTSYTVVTDSTAAFEDGKWYVVSETVEVPSRITVTGTANLILCDGATLTAQKGITVSDGNTLNIFAQSKGNSMGALIATGATDDDVYTAGIGGYSTYENYRLVSYFSAGTVTIHGGRVNANGGYDCAGIGGGSHADGGTVTIYGGEITAIGGDDGVASGIGGGFLGKGGNVAIYGGAVMATGAYHNEYDTTFYTGMGIGGTEVIGTEQRAADNGSLTLGTGMYLYGGTSANPERDLSNHVAQSNGDYARSQYMTVNNVAPHTHNFTYSATGATITATCGNTNCDVTTGLTLTISAPTGSLVYDGNPKPATLSTGYNTTAFPGAHTITYTKDGAALTGVPTDVGTYVASVTVRTATAKVEYTIAKAAQAAPALTVTAQPATPYASGTINAKNGETVSTERLQASSDGGETWTDVTALPYAAKPGTYQFKYKGDDNHSESEITKLLVEPVNELREVKIASNQPDANLYKSGVQNTLTAVTNNDVEGLTLEYKWYREGVAEAVGTGATYTLQASDVGKKLTVVVTDKTTGATEPYTSVSTATPVIVTVAPTTYQITGNVKVPDAENSSTFNNVANANVELRQGNTVFATATTNNDGNYTFSSVPNGEYNIVVTDANGTTKTEYVKVENGNQTINVTMPFYKVSSKVDVKGETPAAVVAGLDDAAADSLTDNEKTGGVTTTMTMEIESTDDLTAKADDQLTDEQKQEKTEQQAIKAQNTGANKSDALDFIDMSVYKRTQKDGESAQVEDVHNLNKVLEILLPYTTANRSFNIFRYHGTAAAKFTQLSTRPTGSFTDGQFFVGDGFIAIYASGFSTYAIGYSDATSPTPTPTPSYPSSGGNGGYSPSTTAITVPVSGDSASVSVSASVSGSTATVKAPTTAQLDKVIGESVKTGEVTIDVSGLNRNIATVSIPTETVKAIEKAVNDPDNDASALTVKLTDGSVTFDAKALAAITDQAKGGTIQLNLDGITESGLRTAQKTAIKDMDVQAIYDAYLTSNGQRISDFKGGKATVTVSYALKDGQIGRGVVVWYVADDGKTTEVPTAYNDKTVSFTVEHFSNYVIAYDAERAAVCPQDSTCPISAFTDADPTAWYHDGVHYVLENGIMSGLGNGQFAPNDTTSRAMLAQILYNMEGKPAIRSGIPFEDVSESDWYAMAISWAESNGIIGGYGNGKFGPNDDLTREQLVTIMYRYAKDKGIDVSVGEDTNILSYDDAFDVSEWAIPAMQWAVGNGLISGRTASTLNPKDKATRAEIATIIMRYCEEIAK